MEQRITKNRKLSEHTETNQGKFYFMKFQFQSYKYVYKPKQKGYNVKSLS